MAESSNDGKGKEEVSVLFVCLGNICRSPMGHAVMEHLASTLPSSAPKLTIDSAGTGAYHAQAPPDPRTTTTLEAHGISGFNHAARKIRASDFSTFDYILAMDADNLEDLLHVQKNAPKSSKTTTGKNAKVQLFGEYGGRGKEEVDDPYYGGGKGFEVAYEQCLRFSRGWLKEVLGFEGSVE